ncbi:Alkanesulfonates ABC transporter ATP-binding protein / Sulfonate ABC transporter, ATP-binding subunit SsuB [Janthinobacterium sp. CG23_2]|nr:Alkanesulfonates ABC transporter ATP-binding protein / Sulfonate ABC transporter, ATP-binding subunit SsuB [Janthinobacterium sp. CG23_2]CUU28414.1 Alkanesulfonates ABC transporter ATP-binding protein / Sulfonate ABC transporter, ATP-binding subunit SsuB [Janthinobacterium sp. CG23_2]
MQKLIESLWQERGFTAVLVTHGVQEALTLADRVLLIENGRLTLDLAKDLPRAGRRGTARFAALEQAGAGAGAGQAGAVTVAVTESRMSAGRYKNRYWSMLLCP